MIAGPNGSSPFEGSDTNSMKRPWNNRLIYTFFLSYLAIIILLAVGFFVYSRNLLQDFYVASLGQRDGTKDACYRTPAAMAE